MGDYETTDDEVMTGITRTITPNETDRLSRVERLLIQLIARQDAQDEKIKSLKTTQQQPTSTMVSSTPYRQAKTSTKTTVEHEMRKESDFVSFPEKCSLKISQPNSLQDFTKYSIKSFPKLPFGLLLFLCHSYIWIRQNLSP